MSPFRVFILTSRLERSKLDMKEYAVHLVWPVAGGLGVAAGEITQT